MARPGLTRSPKFALLARTLGSRALALGCLELIWEPAYENGNPLYASPELVESAADWTGGAGVLACALIACRFLDETPNGLEIHDFWTHAPAYVHKRAVREAERQQRGETISDVRRKAARARWSKVIQEDASGIQTDATDRRLHAKVRTPSTQHPAPIEDSLRSSSCADSSARAEAPAPDPDCPVFRCDGPVPTWKATLEQRARWSAAYPSLSIPAEYAKAHAWIEDNPSKRKTARGMPRFVGGWFDRAQNGAGRRLAHKSTPVEPPTDPFLSIALGQGGHA